MSGPSNSLLRAPSVGLYPYLQGQLMSTLSQKGISRQEKEMWVIAAAFPEGKELSRSSVHFVDPKASLAWSQTNKLESFKSQPRILLTNSPITLTQRMTKGACVFECVCMCVCVCQGEGGNTQSSSTPPAPPTPRTGSNQGSNGILCISVNELPLWIKEYWQREGESSALNCLWLLGLRIRRGRH